MENKKKILLFVITLQAIIMTSCSMSGDMGEYEIETIKIGTASEHSEPLTNEQYSVDSIRFLSMPPNASILEATKLVVENNRIYVLDSRLSNTIYVFDINGNFLFKAGERGRAKNEYIGDPTDFFVDDNNNIHVFDYVGQKIVVFNKNGEVSNVVNTRTYHPYSIGLACDNNYFYAFMSKNEDDMALALCNKKNEITNKFLAFSREYAYLPTQRTFSLNDKRLSHIPLLSDSILIFKNNLLEKIVRIDCGGKFITKEKPELVDDVKKYKEMAEYDGVWNLIQYQETDSLTLLSYINKYHIEYYLRNKSNNREVSGNKIFTGFSPYVSYYLRNNQIVAIIMPDIIEFLNGNRNNPNFINSLNVTPSKIKDLITNGISTPVIVYLKIK